MATMLRRDDWITDALGNAISGASVYVCSQPATTNVIPPSPLEQLYADSAGTIPLTQPVLTDGYGHAFYYTTPGTYTIVYYSPQILTQVLEDQTIGAGNVAFPITIAEGGTNATTAPQALINLNAASRGANSDITSLIALSSVGGNAITVTGTDSSQNALVVTDGIHVSGWQAGGLVIVTGVQCTGEITCGPILSSGGVGTDAFQNATPGSPITLTNAGTSEVALLISGTGVTDQSLLGFVNYPTQTTVGTAGGASALPATPSIYLQLKVNGTVYVFPGYAKS